ncbi:C-terminal binding protein [Amycolatopsis sp. MtRt-6]|uniref:C-terminal binding protein n=1 Tax=Amycolatopsis sp. MtRt-6 TaxID=2792782 RepID=UPI001A907969|nr:C-terminal binding protein [Amycolatopsis sp. MtRt-6]
MAAPVVLYTDPPWALVDGRAEPDTAAIEHAVYGSAVRLELGDTSGGRYVTSGAALAEAVHGVAALAVYRCRVTAELLDAAGPALRVVARQGVGTDNLDLEALRDRGVHSFHVPDYCVDEVATHAMALLLALERGIVAQHNGLAGGRFDIYAGNVPRRLRRRRAGVIGFGRIGKAVAQRLRPFYGEVLAHDPYLHPDLVEGYGVRAAGFAELLAESDVVTLHCPLTDETRHLIDREALAGMRPDALLVNAARGALIEPEALHGALSSGRLGGAGLDVFAPENPHDDPWFAKVVALPNVVVTSHRAFLSAESEASSRRRVAEGVRYVLETGRPAPFGRLTGEEGLKA